MTDRQTLFADIILPLAVPKRYTYRIPHEFTHEVQIGQRVVVQFGSGKKLYSALIERLHEQPPKAYTAKYIESILDDRPIVHEAQLRFWQWITDYYLCTIGEVMVAALPSGLRLASESRILLHPSYQTRIDELSDNEFLVVEALEVRQVLSLNEVSEILNVKHVHRYIKSLIEKQAVMVEEELRQRYKPKMVDYIRLTEAASDEDRLKQHFDELERAPKQLETLMHFIQMNQRYTAEPKEVKKVALQKATNVTSSLINTMVQKEIFEIYQLEAGRIGTYGEAKGINKQLSPAQENALANIQVQFEEKDVVLLHGVTSSGKTEVYIQLIHEALKRGEQVLYLLPEIALTTQIILRLQQIFGDKIGVYHSKFNENEQVEVWNKVLHYQQGRHEDYQIILGARSALFLPFSNLGLVIIDEEHENTFKQYDPAPRYHARDAAIVMALNQKAKVLLGSATPSVESYRNTQEGKYGLVELKKRYGDVQLPEVLCADLKEASKRRQMKGHFSPMLYEAIADTLEKGKQVILFQNRRGYSPILICESCGHSPQCVNCDVSLTYHKYRQQLNCHYCGYHVAVPKTCPACGDTRLQFKGFGTEKIEEDLKLLFPEARTARMDLDTTRSKHAYQKIITSFVEQEVDILVGTQMVTKGLDFEHVALVGILDADRMLFFPDFRAFERSYQLMAQVSGRAGRRGERGKVIIQAFNPHHQIIRQVIDNDFDGMYKNELVDRRNFHYPPFHRLIGLTLKHREAAKLNEAADFFAAKLRERFGKRILGPESPAIGRIRNYYLKNILIKIEQKASLKKAKAEFQRILIDFQSDPDFKSVRVVVDVDMV